MSALSSRELSQRHKLTYDAEEMERHALAGFVETVQEILGSLSPAKKKASAG